MNVCVRFAVRCVCDVRYTYHADSASFILHVVLCALEETVNVKQHLSSQLNSAHQQKKASSVAAFQILSSNSGLGSGREITAGYSRAS